MPRAIAIVGPTASGKTRLAVAVARVLDGEIISLDSRQAYAGFEVGTAAPTPAEREAAPHHGVGFLGPDERYGAGRFVREARRWLEEIEGRGRVPILAGGTGLFLRALTHPLFREPDFDAARRTALGTWLEAADEATLRRWAERLDPELAERPGGADRQRASRTLELALLAGRPLSWWVAHGEPEHPPLAAAVYVLELPAAELRARIERRAEAMLADGAWQAEVVRLAREGYEGSLAFEALGYDEVLELARGRVGRAEALERVRARTWAYARRQRTWFRHQVPSGAVRLDGMKPTDQLARRIADDWTRSTDGS